MTKKQIFISHISEESILAGALKQRLLADFLNLPETFVSSDRTSIIAGRKWLDDVENGLKSAELVIVIASPESVGRPWVNFEAGAAWLRGVPLIPICHSGMTPATLPTPLNLLEAVSLTDADSLQKIYDAVAGALGTGTPAVDFKALAQHFTGLVSQLATASMEIVENPRILCVANEQYSQPEYRFELDVAALEGAFPGRVTVEPKCSRQRLLSLLAEQRFDIVHLVMSVHPDTGALVFSPVDRHTKYPLDPDPKVVPSERFSQLLTEAKTRLLVLATCYGLVPAVEMGAVANMVATEKAFSVQQGSEWAECFYGLLAKRRSVFKAFELTRAQVDTPMRIVRHKDVIFSFARSGSAAGPSAAE